MKFDSFLEKMKEHNRRMDGHCERLIGLNERFEKTLKKLEKTLKKQVTEDEGRHAKSHAEGS